MAGPSAPVRGPGIGEATPSTGLQQALRVHCQNIAAATYRVVAADTHASRLANRIVTEPRYFDCDLKYRRSGGA